jgi:hypothetical protein
MLHMTLFSECPYSNEVWDAMAEKLSMWKLSSQKWIGKDLTILAKFNRQSPQRAAEGNLLDNKFK